MSTVFDPDAYCSDEDIARTARGDYNLIVSGDDQMARGADGTFDAGTPWDLASATVDFAVAGVVAGQVVTLEGVHTQPPSAAYRAFGADGLRQVVSAVAGNTITLRRVGEPGGIGMPPGSGGLAGVKFAVYSLMGPIQDATNAIRRTLGFDVPAEVEIAAEDLRELCIAWVLTDLFLAKMRVGTGSGQVAGQTPYGGDIFQVKYSAYKRRKQDLLDELRSRRIPADAIDSLGVVPIFRHRHPREFLP